MKKIKARVAVGDQMMELETGHLAGLADAAVTARIGETEVLATVTSSDSEENLDYFPLSVDYIERFYAGGKIKGSRWVKREGRPSDEAILVARLIDRSIRPLFSKNYRKRVDVVITVLSVDGENNPDVLGILAASAALAISPLPWGGPIGAVRLGLQEEGGQPHFLVNSPYSQLEETNLDLVFSGTSESIIMMEGSGKEVSEDVLDRSLDTALGAIKKTVKDLEAFIKEAGRKKETYQEKGPSKELVSEVKKKYHDRIEEAAKNTFLCQEGISLGEVKRAIIADFADEDPRDVDGAVEELVKHLVRDPVLKSGKRFDGRKVDEIRPLTVEVGVLPRTHGSAVFTRGNTQALTVATLGGVSLGQTIENMEGEEVKRYMHHYYMPPFSLGETGRIGSPGRREIGHGSLAEMALVHVLPDEERFPYAIRVVSEIMSSNGSTSMASVCGSTLSLMDAGVPIHAPVAGIAMGLMTDGKETVVLTDIIGAEDFMGDMDFKVAGTQKGMTAIQMDVKNTQITLQTLKSAFRQAREGRLFILKAMLAVIDQPRSEVNEYAPKIELTHIPPEKIGEVIGPGGRIIRSIVAETGAEVDVDDTGRVSVSSPDREAVKKAIEAVQNIVREYKSGEKHVGKVVRIEPFGVFVQLAPGRDGLVHVSRMSTEYVEDPNQLVSLGDLVEVRVTEVDDSGRIALSMLSEDQDRERTSQNRSGKDGGYRPRNFDHRDNRNDRYRSRRPRRDRR